MIESLKPILEKLFSCKIIRYGLVGSVSTIIHFSVAFLYIYYINNSVLQSNTIGFLVAYVFSYLMQSKHVFNHEINTEKAIKYFVVQFGSLLFAVILSNLFDSFNSYIKTVIVVGILPLITFVIHKFWTFKTIKVK